MSYQIEFVPEALTELKALPAYMRSQAVAHIECLADTPRPQKAKELRGKPGIYRIWLSQHWRIAYEIDDENLCVIIRRIRRKDNIDYESL